MKAVSKSLVRGLYQLWSRIETGESLGEVDAAVLVAKAGHAPDDGFLETLRFFGDRTAFEHTSPGLLGKLEAAPKTVRDRVLGVALAADIVACRRLTLKSSRRRA